MGDIYTKEREIIVAARKANATISAFKLAKKLSTGEMVGLAGRTFYSIYSVIRRYDAKNKATA